MLVYEKTENASEFLIIVYVGAAKGFLLHHQVVVGDGGRTLSTMILQTGLHHFIFPSERLFNFGELIIIRPLPKKKLTLEKNIIILLTR